MKTIFVYAPNNIIQARDYVRKIFIDLEWAEKAHVQIRKQQGWISNLDVPAIGIRYHIITDIEQMRGYSRESCKLLVIDTLGSETRDDVQAVRNMGYTVDFKR